MSENIENLRRLLQKTFELKNYIEKNTDTIRQVRYEYKTLRGAYDQSKSECKEQEKRINYWQAVLDKNPDVEHKVSQEDLDKAREILIKKKEDLQRIKHEIQQSPEFPKIFDYAKKIDDFDKAEKDYIKTEQALLAELEQITLAIKRNQISVPEIAKMFSDVYQSDDCSYAYILYYLALNSRAQSLNYADPLPHLFGKLICEMMLKDVDSTLKSLCGKEENLTDYKHNLFFAWHNSFIHSRHPRWYSSMKNEVINILCTALTKASTPMVLKLMTALNMSNKSPLYYLAMCINHYPDPEGVNFINVLTLILMKISNSDEMTLFVNALLQETSASESVLSCLIYNCAARFYERTANPRPSSSNDLSFLESSAAKNQIYSFRFFESNGTVGPGMELYPILLSLHIEKFITRVLDSQHLSNSTSQALYDFFNKLPGIQRHIKSDRSATPWDPMTVEKVKALIARKFGDRLNEIEMRHTAKVFACFHKDALMDPTSDTGIANMVLKYLPVTEIPGSDRKIQRYYKDVTSAHSNSTLFASPPSELKADKQEEVKTELTRS